VEAEIPDVPYSYSTIVVTKSRIEKDLLAIPRTLLDVFPKASGSVLLLEDGAWVSKRFAAYDSSTKEARIYGLRDFYARSDVRGGDQLVLNAFGDGQYELVPEGLFRKQITEAESNLDSAKTEADADAAVSAIARAAHARPDEVIAGEFVRLAARESVKERVRRTRQVLAAESIPTSLRVILAGLYEGRCQVSGFTFLKTDGQPYFEVHHINPNLGHHVKNVLVVSPNVHAQFTYADVGQSFDNDGWLRQVSFNGEEHKVFQKMDKLKTHAVKQVHTA
jgi:hypothetical protein